MLTLEDFVSHTCSLLRLTPFSSRGHIRPELHLCFTLLIEYTGLIVTVLPDRRALKRIRYEFAAHPDLDVQVRDRLRIIPVIEVGGPEILDSQEAEIGKEFTGNVERCFTEAVDAGGMPTVILVDVSSDGDSAVEGLSRAH